MKQLFLLLLLTPCLALAQEKDFCKSPFSIAALEQDAFSRTQMRKQMQRGSSASENFDINYFRCEWEVDPAIRYIKGAVTVYFKLNAGGSSITFDLQSAMHTDSVKRKGNLLNYQQANNALVVIFDENINPGQQDSITIYYQGIPNDSGFGSFVQTQHIGTPVIWTLSEPYGAMDWWPCKNAMGNKTDSIDIYIKHPAIYKAASNGLLQSETPSGTHIITHWKHRYPIATYLVCFAVTNYEVFNNSVQLGAIHLPMVTYCYPESRPSFEANTPKVLTALQLFNQYFGEYPFIKEKYGHVQFGWGGGMEHQTSTFLVNANESLMAHELGHQWFGDKLTANSWSDIWLNEGFATFCAAFYMETQYPASAMANRVSVLANITSQPGGTVWVNDTSSVSRIFDQRLTYNKGSYLVNMLRFVLGDSLFFSAIRQYLNTPGLAYGFTQTGKLKAILEQVSGKDLTDFFNQWYWGQGYPSYKVSWSQVGIATVQINVSQVTSHPAISFFKMPVPLTFKKGNQQKTVILNNTANSQDFIEDIGFIADTVLIDPEHWLISKNNSTEKKRIPNSGIGDVDIFPNPVISPTSIRLHDFNATEAEVLIINALAQKVFEKKISLYNGLGTLTLPVQNWAKGFYMATIKAGNKIITKTFIR